MTDDCTKANMLNEYFNSVFTADNGCLTDFARRVPEDVNINFIDINPDRLLY